MSLESRVVLRKAPVSARKMRLVADIIRNEKVLKSLMVLNSLPKHCGIFLSKLLLSAIANLERKKQNDQEVSDKVIDYNKMKIAEVFVNEGGFFKRVMPRSRGKSSQTKTRCCHVVLKINEV
ncbi:MAG: hypothetical protein LBD32_00530 [Cytophagales bacterium]|jgi:large subunit ribosomal protein L22|nr:hypothetical protein [Cytophagales bacterium]